MKSKHLFLAIATLVLVSACSSEDNAEKAGKVPSASKVTLIAGWDAGGSRTVMTSGGSVYWTPTDNIYCNSATVLASSAATFKDEGGTTSKGTKMYGTALFTADEAASYSVLYPSTLTGVTYASGTYTFNFPSSQEYYDNVTFSPGVNPSTAYSTTTSLSFKNACGILKATISGYFTDVKTVRFIAGSQAVSGTATVTPTADGAAMSITSAYTKGSNDYMDITFPTAMNLTTTSPTIYWVLPPTTYTTPMIELLNSSNEVLSKITATKDISVTRAKITSLGTVEMKSEYKAFTLENYFQWDAYSHYYMGYSDNTGAYFKPGLEGADLDTERGWAGHSCFHCPPPVDVEKYLTAGVYWDDGTGIPQQTFTVNGTVYHTGLWLKKLAYTNSSSEDDVKSKSTAEWNALSATDKSKYFFLPAAGYCGSFKDSGTGGYYWTPKEAGSFWAYSLIFNSSRAYLKDSSRGSGYCLWTVQ